MFSIVQVIVDEKNVINKDGYKISILVSANLK